MTSVLPHVHKSTFGCLSERIDVFTPRDGEGHRVGQFFDEQVGRERSFLVQRSIEGCYHGLLDLRPAKAVACADDLAEVELLAVLLPESQVNRPDAFPLGIVWQID